MSTPSNAGPGLELMEKLRKLELQVVKMTVMMTRDEFEPEEMTEKILLLRKTLSDRMFDNNLNSMLAICYRKAINKDTYNINEFEKWVKKQEQKLAVKNQAFRRRERRLETNSFENRNSLKP